jgi:hypothetical protein
LYLSAGDFIPAATPERIECPSKQTNPLATRAAITREAACLVTNPVRRA